MITWLGQIGLPLLPARPADWPADVPFPPSPRPDGSAPRGWPAGRPWPPPAPAGWPSVLAWPNPRPPPEPAGWQGPWPLAPTCWNDVGLPWPPPAPVFWVQTGLPWPPLPGEALPSWAIVPWWPTTCPINVPQPTAAPPAPTAPPPVQAAPPALRQPPPAPPASPAPPPATAPTQPATLAQALENPVIVFILVLGVIRTIASVARVRR